MKDNKFTVMCILGATWFAIFIATLCGERIHPRVEQMVTFLCVGWFAYWTLTSLFGKEQKPETETTEPTKESVPENGNTEKTPESSK